MEWRGILGSCRLDDCHAGVLLNILGCISVGDWLNLVTTDEHAYAEHVIWRVTLHDELYKPCLSV